MTSAIDRSAAAQARPKAIAYHQGGKATMAKEWAQRASGWGHISRQRGGAFVVSKFWSID